MQFTRKPIFAFVQKHTCRFNAQKPKKGQISKFYKVPADNEEELKKAVAFHGPVAVGINSRGLKLFKSTGEIISFL